MKQLAMRNFGWGNFGTNCSMSLEIFGTKFPNVQACTQNGGQYILEASGWLLLFPRVMLSGLGGLNRTPHVAHIANDMVLDMNPQ